MKIAIDCRMIGSGGIGSYISALLPYFIKENECLLFGTKEQLEKFSGKENTEVFYYDEKCFSLKEIIKFPKNLLSKINACDVFYTPYCNIPGGIKIPVFSTIHDVVFLDVPGLASKTGTFIRKLFYLRACRKSRIIFTVSNFSADRIKYHLHTKTPVVCTYNALPDWFLEKDSSSNAENASSNSTLATNCILFVGNIKKHKGLSTLIEAYAQAKEKGLKSKLLIVGNKNNFRTSDDSIFEKIGSLPENSVSFTGKINETELKNIYKSAKVLVQPSLYEGFGMPPLEAMSLGTPVIMSDIPVFKEIYRDFPVTFFKTGDSRDLCSKLLEFENKKQDTLKLPDIYSFEKTYKIIKNTLETSK